MDFTAGAVLPDIIVLDPDIHQDKRGHFLEVYQKKRYASHGITDSFVQDNLSYSTKGVLRGLHYQLDKPQGKLVWVVHGEVFDVAVDIRHGSPTFGKWSGMTLSSKQYRQMFVPQGFAHGFCVVSESASVLYKCTEYYAPQTERGIRWDDLSLGIKWPEMDPIVSKKDRQYPALKDIPHNELPVFCGL